MAAIVSMHSFRGGTGKSNAAANLAVLAAAQGKRVGVVDLDMHSPGVHVVLGFEHVRAERTLNDFLDGACEIDDAAYEVYQNGTGAGGGLFVVPASMDASAIARIVRDGYDVSRLSDGIRRLIQELELDLLILDTHPGLGEETLLSIALSDVLVILLRPDQQDYEGTKVTVTVAQRLQVPTTLIVVNKVPSRFDPVEVSRRVGEAYGTEIGAVFPHSDDLMTHSSDGAFVALYPDHEVTARYRELLARITREA